MLTITIIFIVNTGIYLKIIKFNQVLVLQQKQDSNALVFANELRKTNTWLTQYHWKKNKNIPNRREEFNPF